MWNNFPAFGTALLLCVMVAAGYTFATALAAGSSGRIRTLVAARYGAYGTVALVASAVVCLAYAFVTHDFRIRYVAHYSDRSMSLPYLFTALWGGQDGSLLWWLFLLSIYIGVCVKWLGHKYLELQPYIIATLMVVVIFFAILMAFSANPFATTIAGAREDGQGLNPLLQNFYMIIHPPSLYIGFVGCTIPFAFAVAALVTGRLDQEWMVACRKWTLFAWLFLAIGNTLGMVWAYEELGWGGYWAWDPVENAAFMPFLSATAFIHSVMIQERRGLLKTWNIALVCFTFFMTIFGTFLTRSGAIASVHSFAQSSIGSYFLWFLAFLFVAVTTLILFRWPELRDLPPNRRLRHAAVTTGWVAIAIFGPGLYAVYHIPASFSVRIMLLALTAGAGVYATVELVFRRMTRGLRITTTRPVMESVFSREFTFLMNNWGLLGLLGFILVATTFPMISEAFWAEKVTVGPPFYNAWVQPLGLLIFLLMGVGTLFGWKKTSPEALRRVFRIPLAVLALAAIAHVAFGAALGFPAVVWSDSIYPGQLGLALRAFNAFTPLLGFSLCAFNGAIIAQEFALLFRARIRSGAVSTTPKVLWYAGLLPGFFHTLISLSPASRRRYGGYLAHLGIVLMFIGFTGKSWSVDRETSLSPGQKFEADHYSLEYIGPRMEVDNTKRMVFADILVTRDGKSIGKGSPAKFIYKKMPESPTTEVAMLHSIRDDLYLVVGTINPQTKVASLQVHINPLVSWIWLGCIVLIFGSIVCMWPEAVAGESRGWAFVRSGAATLASITVGVLIALTPATAIGQTASSMHAGTVHIENPTERALFQGLRCMCGGCARDILSTCACDWASSAREKLRAKLQSGMDVDRIVAEYSAEYGSEALSVPPNAGALRLIYLAPVAGIVAGAAGLGLAVRRWKRAQTGIKAPPPVGKKESDDYDARLDDELSDVDSDFGDKSKRRS